MRLAVYSHYFRPEIGAPSARIGDLSAAWIDRGHEVHVATCFPNHPTGVVYPGYALASYRHERIDGVHVHRSWTYVTRNTGFVKKSLGHLSLWASAGVTSTRRMPKPDCAIGTSPTFFAAMAARACARHHRVPFVMEVRDLWPAIFVDLGVIRNRFIIRLLERWELGLYRSAARIVTVTESFRENLIARGVPAEKVATITNGADTDYWRPDPAGAARLRAELGLREAFVVLYIGAHGISQGLAAHLKAAARLAGHPHVQFVFVGEGADKPRLVAEAQKLGLANVRFLDPVDKANVRAFYSLADVCLVPLRALPLFDAFIPSKMFEIMATGRPVLASVRGEAARILERSGAARVVAPDDDADLAQGILELAADARRLQAMGERGRPFVLAHYSRRQLADRYLQVIGEARASMGLGGA